MIDTPVLVVGSVLAGRHPLGLDGRNPELLHRLLDRGVSTFIDLTELGELPPHAGKLPAGVHHTRVPITDGGVPTPDQARIVRKAVISRNPNERIYIHCRAGYGRTAVTLVAAQLFGRAGSSRTHLHLAQLARARSCREMP